ncbi:MAG: C-GCAxxG-C-C family protein [Proteobacteria bacterium]|nr:C-GCAxxG-C-C family protein [Pseudomonadota bacterium]
MDDTLIRLMTLGGKGYSCGQILIAMALEERGESNPGLVRALAGLAYGGGNGLGTCGALTGGNCILGLYAGKGRDDESESERLPAMMQELSDWFVERAGARFGGITCEAIVGEAGPDASRQTCGSLVAETFEKAMEVLVIHGFDPAG